MCGSVQNNRPASPPAHQPPRQPPVAPPVVSPERPLAVRNDRDNVGGPERPQRSNANCGHSQRDVFEGGQCAAPKRGEQPGFLRKLERMFQKLEKYLPGIGDFARGMIESLRRERDTPVNPVSERRQLPSAAPR